MKGLPTLRFVRRVKREHGEKFVTLLHELLLKDATLGEASSPTGIIEWPDVETISPMTPAQRRYFDVEAEIVARAFEAVRPAFAEAYVNIASAVIKRERERQRRG